MKRALLLMAALAVSGCAGIANTAATPKRSRNAQCLASPKLRIISILKDGIIANLCPTEFKSFYSDAFEACSMEGTRIYLPVKPDENNYVDDQKVTLTEDKCFAEDGVYTHSDETAKQIQKAFEKAIEDKIGEKVDLGDSKQRIRKLKIINIDA